MRASKRVANEVSALALIYSAPAFASDLSPWPQYRNGAQTWASSERDWGVDTLTGGTGSDQFRYFFATDSGTGAAAVRITDFEIGIDKLNFTLIDADPITGGDQAFAFLGTGAFTSPGTGQIRYLNSGADLLVQVDVDGNGTVDMEVVLQGLAGQTLTSGDFML